MNYMTNAHHNRKQAQRLSTAGWKVADIVAEFPATFWLDADGKMGLRYSTEATEFLQASEPIAKEFGIKEQDHMVSSELVSRLIAGREN